MMTNHLLLSFTHMTPGIAIHVYPAHAYLSYAYDLLSYAYLHLAHAYLDHMPYLCADDYLYYVFIVVYAIIYCIVAIMNNGITHPQHLLGDSFGPRYHATH
jgi:hypothetical protein